MNRLRFIMQILFVSLLITSCSSDDSNGDNNNNNEPITGDYFPSAATNIWTYDVDNTSSTNPELNFTDESDFVTIETSNGNIFTVEVNNGGMPYGIMNGLMSNGTLSRGESTLSFSGNIELPEEFEDFSDETIVLQNFVLYDLNASNNSEMDEVSDTIVENLDLNGTIVPVTVEYSVKSEKINTMNSMSVNGETYSNVIHTRLTLNMNIFASIDILGGNNPLDYDIIDDQNILVIDNYFSQDVGLIRSQAVQAYQVEQQFLDILALIPNNNLDIPESLNIVNVQDLDDYQVN